MNKRFLPTLVLVFILGCGTDTQGPTPKATVTQKEARFWFPVKHPEDTWTWNVATDDYLEYSWTVILSLGEQKYEVGFTTWKHSSESKTEGSFSELLRSGQVNVWESRSGSVVEEFQQLKAQPETGGLLIAIEDAKFLKMLNGHRPSSVIFKTEGKLHRRSRREVTVKYE